MAQPCFEDLIFECIERGMSSLGESASKAVIWHIEQSNRLKRGEIAGNPSQFIRGLERMLGLGSVAVERMIVKEIDSVFNIKAAKNFEDAVSQARKVYK